MPSESRQQRPLSIAIAALGGQGGGVLADWLVTAAELHGWIAQSTSIPGVAQRTGTTVYYLEIVPPAPKGQRAPVMALMPVSGDVDLVIGAELMEAGRAVVRGFVSPERTTTIASSHRIYGITEKSAMGDGIADGNAVFAALEARSRRLICFDMQALADEHGSVISSVLFGAIAASGALPFPRSVYEQAITSTGIAVKTNLAGFAAGFERALTRSSVTGLVPPAGAPVTELGRALDARIASEFPAHLHGLIQQGVRRMLDYQDGAYANLYLDRLKEIRDCDRKVAPASSGHALTGAVARYLALWMSYEDTIRVADLKTREARFTRFRDEVRAAPDQLVYVTEFMHPRFEEICDTLPAALGKRLLNSALARKALLPFVSKGRHIHTGRIRGFLMLCLLAGMRRWRRTTLRHHVEEQRITVWLSRVQRTASEYGYEAAIEIAECQRLIKGYSDTHERGLKNYGTLMSAIDRIGARPDLAQIIRRLRNAALADEDGQRLQAALAELDSLEDPPCKTAAAC